jgi:hypothetical protein
MPAMVMDYEENYHLFRLMFITNIYPTTCAKCGKYYTRAYSWYYINRYKAITQTTLCWLKFSHNQAAARRPTINSRNQTRRSKQPLIYFFMNMKPLIVRLCIAH